MNKEEIEIIEKEINNLNEASQCALSSGKERKDWIILANAMEKMLKENKQLKERIDKAIEYLDHHYATPARTGMMFHECENVIEILKGE